MNLTYILSQYLSNEFNHINMACFEFLFIN